MRRLMRRWMTLTMFLAIFFVHLTRWTNAGSTSLYVANEGNGTVRQFSASGTDLGNFTSGLNQPSYMSSGPAGNLCIPEFRRQFRPRVFFERNPLMTISTPSRREMRLVAANGTILVSDYLRWENLPILIQRSKPRAFFQPGVGSSRLHGV